MNKINFIKLRVQPDEKEAFELAAGEAGISLSAWMRRHLRTAARQELEDVGEQVPFARKKTTNES
jgi:uncharacterized protein (DUF1778 family)